MMEEKIEDILSPVTDESEIEKAQDRMETSWKALAKHYTDMKVGIKHGNERFDCYYIEPFNAWAAFSVAGAKPNRFWNAFGLGKLSKVINNNIICEINFSFTGDRKVAGLIAKDKNGDKYILHSGKIGGNYNQEIFWDRYNGEIRYISGTSDAKRYAFVSRSDSDLLINNIVDFIKEVKRIKFM